MTVKKVKIKRYYGVVEILAWRDFTWGEKESIIYSNEDSIVMKPLDYIVAIVLHCAL